MIVENAINTPGSGRTTASAAGLPALTTDGDISLWSTSKAKVATSHLSEDYHWSL